MKLSWGMLSWCVALSVSVSAQTNTVIVPVSNTIRHPFFADIPPFFSVSGDLLLARDYASVSVLRVEDSGNTLLDAILSDLHSSGTLAYGTAADLEGDRAVVSDTGSATYGVGGRIYSYRRIAGSWTLESQSTPFSPSLFYGDWIRVSGERALIAGLGRVTVNSPFGALQEIDEPWWGVNSVSRAMDIEGDTLAVFLPQFASVLVYQERPGFGFQLTYILRDDGTVTDGGVIPPLSSGPFVAALAVRDDTVFVGVPVPGPGLPGVVRVYRETAIGVMSLIGELRASDAANLGGFDFGSHLSVSGDRLLVSAPAYTAAEGACYLFREDSSAPSGWNEEMKFVPVNGHENLSFAWSAEIDGDRVFIHAFEPGSGGVVRFLDVPGAGAEYSAICNGNGGDSSGCTPCPCGNDQLAGSVGGCLNSLGIGARLAAKGRASLGGDTLAMEISGALSESFALLAMGSAAAPSFPGAPCPPGSGVTNSGLDGLLCLGGNLERLSPRAVDENGEVGVTNDGWGAGSTPLIAGRGFVAGQSVYYQAIYRDAPTGGSACGTQLNTTNALRVVVQP